MATITVFAVTTKAAAVAAGLVQYGVTTWAPTPQQWQELEPDIRAQLAEHDSEQDALELPGGVATWEAVVAAARDIVEARRVEQLEHAAEVEQTVRAICALPSEQWMRSDGLELKSESIVFEGLMHWQEAAADPRVKEAAARARLQFCTNLNWYTMRLVEGTRPFPVDGNGKPVLPYVFDVHGAPDELKAALVKQIELWEQRQAERARQQEANEEAERENIRVWIVKHGSTDLRVAHEDGYDVLSRLADEVTASVSRQILAALTAAGCEDGEPVAVLVEGSPRERASGWEEREAPTARAVRRSFRLDVAVGTLKDLPHCVSVEVSRVMRVKLQLEAAPQDAPLERKIAVAMDPPMKITAVLVTVCVPDARARILVFPAE